MNSRLSIFSFFFFNDTATTEIYTLSLHDALPISASVYAQALKLGPGQLNAFHADSLDRKSTRLNSSHSQISYAVFCLKKKKMEEIGPPSPTKKRASSAGTNDASTHSPTQCAPHGA